MIILQISCEICKIPCKYLQKIFLKNLCEILWNIYDIYKYCEILYNTRNTIMSAFPGFHYISLYFSFFTILYTLWYSTSLQLISELETCQTVTLRLGPLSSPSCLGWQQWQWHLPPLWLSRSESLCSVSRPGSLAW